MNVRRPGFTLIELLLVIFIMILLTVMALPLFYQFVKTSRVQQTASIVSTTIARARMEAMRTRKMVGIFFGDNPSLCATKPTPGILPANGRIEIWTVKDNSATALNDEGGVSAGSGPFNDQGTWYPYMFPDRCLTPEPITFPDGVRILAGEYTLAAGPTYQFGWAKMRGGYQDYMPTPDGEIKRHTITFSRQGAMAGWFDGLNSWWNVIIYDTETGEHQLISCGQWLCTSTPRMLPFKLNSLTSVSNTVHPITATVDIAKYAEQ
jgi:type II secretory pathway pseudopilin PulG